jgi:phosphatidate cytidylyltransferase
MKKNVAILPFTWIAATYVSIVTDSYISGGRWWTYFALCSVALNDACAYFAGRIFGRHSLIGLSPNKTIEGFLGGLIANMMSAYLCAQYYLQGDFWQCPPYRLNYGLFEDYSCDSSRLASVYQI